MDQQAVAKRHPAEAHALGLRPMPFERPLGGLAHPSTRRHEPGVEAGRELDVGDGGALVGAVNQRRRLEQAQRRAAGRTRRRSPSRTPCGTSGCREKPGITIGTRVASGSTSASHSAIASASGDSAGDCCRSPRSVNSISSPSVERAEQLLGPCARPRRRRRPGGTRQSTRTSALRRDHVVLVGRAAPGSGPSSPAASARRCRRRAAARGARRRSTAASSSAPSAPARSSPSTASRNAIPAGGRLQRRLLGEAGSRAGASLSSALSPSAGTEPWPGDAAGAQQEAEDALLADAERVEAPAVELERGARRPR